MPQQKNEGAGPGRLFRTAAESHGCHAGPRNAPGPTLLLCGMQTFFAVHVNRFIGGANLVPKSQKLPR